MFFVMCLCLALALLAGSAAWAEAAPSAGEAGHNGIPVVRLNVDPEELQKVNGSADHSYSANGCTIRIEIPEGYESEFGEIDPETTEAELPLEYLRGRDTLFHGCEQPAEILTGENPGE